MDVPDGVAFPDGQEPDPNKVTMVTSDILVARDEIQLYMQGRHPRPEPFEKYLPMKARYNLQELSMDALSGSYVFNKNCLPSLYVKVI